MRTIVTQDQSNPKAWNEVQYIMTEIQRVDTKNGWLVCLTMRELRVWATEDVELELGQIEQLNEVWIYNKTDLALASSSANY
jgi:hypothetical protein